MTFNLEKVDLSKLEALYFLRGYESNDNDDYCTLLVLRGDEQNKHEAGPFISRKTLTIKDGKELWKYLESKGLRITSANVLEEDFERFYGTRAFKRILEG